MELSPKGILTPFQSAIMDRFFHHTRGFFLSGGAALAEFYLGHRFSKDIDLFCAEDAAFAEGIGALEAAAKELGATLASQQKALMFHRYVVGKGGQAVLVDLVRDTGVQVVPEKPVCRGIRVDAIQDIASNKLCAILGRFEVRDYIDLYCLARSGVSLDAALTDAERKDGGLSKTMLALLMNRFRIEEMPDYLRTPLSREDVQRFFQDLSERWARESAPDQSKKP